MCPTGPGRPRRVPAALASRPRRGPRSAAGGYLPGPAEILVVVDLHPVDLADGRDRDRAPPVGQFLEAVLVVERGIAAPGGLERRRQRFRGGRVDERRADVLAVGSR